MSDVMISTTDNPFNPFVQFDLWWAFDRTHGYHSMETLARLVNVSDDMPDDTINSVKEDAIDSIVALAVPLRENVFYRKVKREDFSKE